MGGDQHQNHAWYGVRMPAVFCRKTRADRIGFQLRTRDHESFGREPVHAAVVIFVAALFAGICHHCDCVI